MKNRLFDLLFTFHYSLSQKHSAVRHKRSTALKCLLFDSVNANLLAVLTNTLKLNLTVD